MHRTKHCVRERRCFAVPLPDAGFSSSRIDASQRTAASNASPDGAGSSDRPFLACNNAPLSAAIQVEGPGLLFAPSPQASRPFAIRSTPAPFARSRASLLLAVASPPAGASDCFRYLRSLRLYPVGSKRSVASAPPAASESADSLAPQPSLFQDPGRGSPFRSARSGGLLFSNLLEPSHYAAFAFFVNCKFLVARFSSVLFGISLVTVGAGESAVDKTRLEAPVSAILSVVRRLAIRPALLGFHRLATALECWKALTGDWLNLDRHRPRPLVRFARRVRGSQRPSDLLGVAEPPRVCSRNWPASIPSCPGMRQPPEFRALVIRWDCRSPSFPPCQPLALAFTR